MRTATLLLLIGPAVGWKLRELAASDCLDRTSHGQRMSTNDPEDKNDSCDADTWHGRTCDRMAGGSSCDKCDTGCDKTGRNCCDGGCDGCCDDNCPGDPMPPQLPSPAYPPSVPPHPPIPPFLPPSPSAPPNPPSAPPRGSMDDDQLLSVLEVTGIVLGALVAVGIVVGVAYYVYKRHAASSERVSAVATVEPTAVPSKGARIPPGLFFKSAFGR